MTNTGLFAVLSWFWPFPTKADRPSSTKAPGEQARLLTTPRVPITAEAWCPRCEAKIEQCYIQQPVFRRYNPVLRGMELTSTTTSEHWHLLPCACHFDVGALTADEYRVFRMLEDALNNDMRSHIDNLRHAIREACGKT